MSHDELPRELAELFDAERSSSVRELVSEHAVRAKVAATVGSAPLGAAAAGGAITKALATFGVVVAAGTGALAIRHVTSVPVEKVAAPTAVAAPPRAAEPAAVPRLAVVTQPIAAPPMSPAGPSTSRRMAPRSRPTIITAPSASEPTEVSLLRDAWGAMSRGDASAALALARRDASLYPAGSLTEERDALTIEALAALDRRDDAITAATTFFNAHPSSMYRASIEAALKETP